MALVSSRARRLRDAKLEALCRLPFDQLVRTYSAENEREVIDVDGRAFEVYATGSFDTDQTSDFFVWVYVRPAWIAGIPFLRWLFSARGHHLAANPAARSGDSP